MDTVFVDSIFNYIRIYPDFKIFKDSNIEGSYIISFTENLIFNISEEVKNLVEPFCTKDITDLPQNTIKELLPINPEHQKSNEYTSRFSSAIWYDEVKKKQVLLAGIGGIGSWAALLLSRCNIDKLIVYDPDVVDNSNISGQFYNKQNVYNSKVSQIKYNIKNFSDFNNFWGFDYLYTDSCAVSDIMICGFDNMESRKLFFNKWKSRVLNYHSEKYKQNCLFIDGRLSSEVFQIFCIQGTDSYHIQKYESDYLFKDDEADNEICSNKQTSFMANMIASFINNLFVNFCANSIEGENKLLVPRDLPFFIEYIGETMHLKTEY